MSIFIDKRFDECLHCKHVYAHHLIQFKNTMWEHAGYADRQCMQLKCGCLSFVDNNLDWVEQEARQKGLV